MRIKHFSVLTRLLFVISLLLLTAASTAYCGANPPLPGEQWKGPAILADVEVRMVDGLTVISYVASCGGEEFSGEFSTSFPMSDFTDKDSWLYRTIGYAPICKGPDFAKPIVQNVPQLELVMNGEFVEAIIAKVVMMYSVAKKNY